MGYEIKFNEVVGENVKSLYFALLDNWQFLHMPVRVGNQLLS